MAKKQLPKVSVLDRRLAHPFGSPSQPITLKTEGDWAVRIVNSTVRSGRLHDIIHNKGWVYVTPDELHGHPDELGFQAKDGRLVRGEHGEEVLMKIPQADFDAVQEAKSALNIKNLGKKKTADAVAQETAVKFGSEAGDAVHQRIDVSDSRERVELEPSEA